MAVKPIQHVTIVGVGLLGGSLGLALKAMDQSIRVAGVGRRRESLQKALDAEAIDEAYLDAAEPAGRSDLIVLATPVGAFEQHLRAIAPAIKTGATVTDVGSTKAVVVRTARRVLGKAGPFVGSHPMAGSERKGPAYARANLYDGATCIITPTPDTPSTHLRRVEQLWNAVGMRVVRMTPAAHDKAVANISHLPHLLAALLMLQPSNADIAISAGGFRDATRMAGGDPEMWRDILLTNGKAILAALDALDENICHLRDMISLGDAAAIEKLLAAAKTRREATILNSRQGGE